MGRLSCFVLGAALGAAAMFISLKYHVVRAQDGVHLIPKMQSEFRQTYVDVRGFTTADWDRHRELAVAVVKADKAYLLQDSLAGDVRRSVDSILRNLQGPDVSLPAGGPIPDGSP